MKNLIIIVILVVAVFAGYSYFQDIQNQTDSAGTMVAVSAVPESAKGPAIPQDKGYLVEEISDGLYWLTEGTYQVMFLTTGEGVIVVDAPPSIGENILAAIAEVTDEPITTVIYSHHHADHIAAAGIYPEDAVYIAQKDTAALIERSGDQFGAFLGGSPVPKPQIIFDDTYTLRQGNQTLELAYRGTNHSPGNTFIYAPKQKVLMFIDVIFPGWVPFMELAVSVDVPGYLAAHDQVLSYDFETLISGHLTRLGTRQDVETQKEYLNDIVANAARALQTVDFMAIANKVGFANQWALFGAYLGEVNAVCADLTLEKWEGRLGGAPEFTTSHCARIAESLRID